MSTLERRLQLLLDHERYARVAAEAERSGRSVNAVIREAIDAHYPVGAESRAVALGEFLALTASSRPGPSDNREWSEIKRELEDAWDAEISKGLEV
ncbi:hypothetical protein N802_05295 [Knoellia sinensis KCTC 19936]|uniref:Uncharacterized protein n=1 Tax=Knoellia sinensis KCTC 19936 TaxID=1385520 RepID=A0A0A0J625_9MICO|nr:ribbon-helix-helix protein, CopG family [Knoellia sinensis]KGN31021.1 hypothetical protein N802_05295 [Knoellia sinensis KCTC 19936]